MRIAKIINSNNNTKLTDKNLRSTIKYECIDYSIMKKCQ